MVIRKDDMSDTQQFLNELGRVIGNLSRNRKISDDLYGVVHSAMENDAYGAWQRDDDDDDDDGYDDGYDNYSEDMAAFAQGWQEGRHGTADPAGQCSLGMCACSMGDPDRPVVRMIAPAALGAQSTVPEGFTVAPSDYVHALAARCDKCGHPKKTYFIPGNGEGLDDRIGGYCANPFC